MLLDKSSTRLQIVLAGAKTTLDCDWSAVVNDVTRDAVVPGILYTGVTDGATVVNAIPAPADITARQITELFVYNKDSANVVVFVQYIIGVTVRIIKKSTLTPGQTLTYQTEFGWTVN